MSEEDYLSELVAFRSWTENKAESKKCAAYCANFFENAGLHTELFEFNGYTSLVATTKKTKKPKVFLAAHLDVVPGKDELFKLVKEENKLMGRGVFDMKYACASYMKIVDMLGPDIYKYDFGIMLTFDEEIGGVNGTKKLIENGYSSEICILPDSGHDWKLQLSARGGWWFKITALGKSAHGSEPEKGINASEILNHTVTKILDIRDQLNLPETTLCLTKISGGSAINQVPDFAQATFDLRYDEKENCEKLKNAINEICKNDATTVETLVELAPSKINTADPIVAEFVKIVEEVIGRKISTIKCKGSTDARYFAEVDVPCILIQPHGGGRHSDVEWIEVGGMEKLTNIVLQFLSKYSV